MTSSLRIRFAGELHETTVNTNKAAEMLGHHPIYLRTHRGTGRLCVEPIEDEGRRLRWPLAKIADALGLPYEVVQVEAGS